MIVREVSLLAKMWVKTEQGGISAQKDRIGVGMVSVSIPYEGY